MTLEDDLIARSDAKCELCGAEDALTVYEIPADSNGSADECILAVSSPLYLCQTRSKQLSILSDKILMVTPLATFFIHRQLSCGMAFTDRH